MSFGSILRNLLEEREMTQKELAAQLNIAPSTMGSYIQGVREPDFATLIMLADYFHVSTDYLLNHQAGNTTDHMEDELLYTFRKLTQEQKEISLEQCKAFIRINNKHK